MTDQQNVPINFSFVKRAAKEIVAVQLANDGFTEQTITAVTNLLENIMNQEDSDFDAALNSIELNLTRVLDREAMQ
jgi:hypothetical protein